MNKLLPAPQRYATALERHYIELARITARNICARQGHVTANDIREEIGDPPEGCSPTIMGAIFSEKGFQCLGYVKSARKVSHGRPVARFRWVPQQ